MHQVTVVEYVLVGGVAGLGAAVGHLHLLSIAVVGGDKQDIARLLAAFVDLGNGLVASLNGGDGGIVLDKVSHVLPSAGMNLDLQLRYVRRDLVVSKVKNHGWEGDLSCQEQPGSMRSQ